MPRIRAVRRLRRANGVMEQDLVIVVVAAMVAEREWGSSERVS